MHELSIASNLVQTVTDALADSPSVRILRVRLRVGVLSSVEPESLQFCYDIVTRGTRLEGADLEIITVPLAIRCPACQLDVDLPKHTDLRCPRCGQPSGAIVRGKELEVESIEVVDPAEDTP